jgi:hypothetical protein
MPLELSEEEMAALAELLSEATEEAERDPIPPRLRPLRGGLSKSRDGKRSAAERSPRPRIAVTIRRR